MAASIEESLIQKLRGLPPEQQRELLNFVEKLEQQSAQKPKTIWEEIREIVADMPDEVWKNIPRDGSENLDHYLYGAPKK